MSEESSADQPAPADDQPAPDFQTAFWAAKHALSMATAAAFSRHGVHEGQQFILRRLWARGRADARRDRPAARAGHPHRDQGGHPDGGGRLLRREPHPGDRRLVRLVLTERGRSLEHVIAAETDKLTERALATFGPAERETVIRALAAIRRNLTGA